MSKLPLALLALGLAIPAHAEDTPDWWLVYDKDRSGPARFVDLAGLRATSEGSRVPVLTVDPAGGTESRSATIRCAGSPEPHSIPAFICGSQDYRQRNGLNIRDFPPSELARIYFQTGAG